MAQINPTIKSALAPFLKVLTNKYLIVLMAAGAWMLFFDRYNWQAHQKMDQRIAELEDNFEFYNSAIHSLDYQRDLIYSDLEEMERFAREKHLMKKPGEDIYLSVIE